MSKDKIENMISNYKKIKSVIEYVGGFLLVSFPVTMLVYIWSDNYRFFSKVLVTHGFFLIMLFYLYRAIRKRHKELKRKTKVIE